jgi:hypothetical protein
MHEGGKITTVGDAMIHPCHNQFGKNDEQQNQREAKDSP